VAVPDVAVTTEDADAALRATSADRGPDSAEGFRLAGLAALAFGVSYVLAGRVRRQWQRRRDTRSR
jgi:hypothetical protein